MNKFMLGAAIATILGAVFFISVAPAQANFFTDTIDAIRGHIDDVEDRINHEDEVVEGYVFSTSEFRDSDVGRDAIHWANGSVSLVVRGDITYIQLGTDFVTGPAPDLYIYVANQKVVDEGTFWSAKPIEVAKLKSGSGAQYYELPVSMDGHVEVIIWCKRFGAFIGAATL